MAKKVVELIVCSAAAKKKCTKRDCLHAEPHVKHITCESECYKVRDGELSGNSAKCQNVERES